MSKDIKFGFEKGVYGNSLETYGGVIVPRTSLSNPTVNSAKALSSALKNGAMAKDSAIEDKRVQTEQPVIPTGVASKFDSLQSLHTKSE